MKTWVIEKFIRWKIWRYECDISIFRKHLFLISSDLEDLASVAYKLGLLETHLFLKSASAKILIIKHKKDLQ